MGDTEETAGDAAACGVVAEGGQEDPGGQWWDYVRSGELPW